MLNEDVLIETISHQEEGKKMNYERKALIIGIFINIFSAICGIVFFVITNSKSLLLDGLISTILVISTIFSLYISKKLENKESHRYPLGNWPIENLFLLFRSILMILTILLSLVSALATIILFSINNEIVEVDASLLPMLIYGILMVGSCLLITITYSYFNKKIKNGSEIIKIEIKSSIYDGLVTLFTVSGLLLFDNLTSIEWLSKTGDSIIVIILSIIYIISPIKEIYNQTKILTDKRRDELEEKRIYDSLSRMFPQFAIFDVYYSFSHLEGAIYICLFPNSLMDSDKIDQEFNEIRNYLYKEYHDPKVILLLSKTKLHRL